MDLILVARSVGKPTWTSPLHSITEWHSLSPSSSTRIAIDLPYGLSSQWERYGFTVFRLSARVGEVLSIRRRSFVHDREGLSPCDRCGAVHPTLGIRCARTAKHCYIVSFRLIGLTACWMRQACAPKVYGKSGDKMPLLSTPGCFGAKCA